MELVQKRLKHYSFGEILGRGAVGLVYAGVHLETKQEVAIKIMNASVNYENEIEYCRKISHAHSLSIIECGLVESKAYIVYQRVETTLGRVVKKWASKPDQVSSSKRIQLAGTMLEQLLPVLEIFQRENILHSDLHPDNVMVDTKETRFYIHDYGIAQELLFEDEPSRDDVFSLLCLAGYMITLEYEYRPPTYSYDSKGLPGWLNSMVHIVESLKDEPKAKVPYDRLIHLAKIANEPEEVKSMQDREDMVLRKAMHSINNNRDELCRALNVVCDLKGMERCQLISKEEFLMGTNLQILQPHPRAQVFVYTLWGQAYFLFKFDNSSVRLRVSQCLLGLNTLPTLLNRQ